MQPAEQGGGGDEVRQTVEVGFFLCLAERRVRATQIPFSFSACRDRALRGLMVVVRPIGNSR